MKTTLRTDITIADICNGFVYNELEGKGLYGLSGRLVIQPEFQRNYIYADGKRDVAVVESVCANTLWGLSTSTAWTTNAARCSTGSNASRV